MAEILLTIDPSKSSQPLRELADTLQEIQRGVEQTEQAFNSSFKKSSNVVDNTTRAIDEQTKSNKRNADAVEDVEKGVVEFAKKSKRAYDDKPGDDYTKSVKQADKATDGLGDSLDSTGQKSESVFSGLTEGIKDVGGQFEQVGGTLISGNGGGITKGLTGILARLGPIGLAIGAVVGIVGALGSEIIKVDEKFDNLRGTVEELFGITGEAADNIVVNVEAIATTFDVEVNEVILTTNTLMKEFGISADEATSLLSRGLNSAANAQGDLIQSVKEFSSQIRASGGEASDLFAILEKSNKEGIFSDKGIDVVKEFGLRIREQADGTRDALSSAFGSDFTDDLLKGVDSGTISSIDALKLVSEQLGTLEENSAEAQTVIADVFGGAGEDAGFRFLSLLKDINTEQGFGNEQLTEEQQRKQDSLEANQRLARAQNDLSKAIGDSSAIGRVWTEIQTGFFKVLLGVVRGVEDLIKGFELLKEDPIEGLKLIGQVILDYALIPLNLAIDAANYFNDVLGFDFDIPNISAGREAIRDYTDAQERNIEVTRIAQTAIKQFGTETGILVGKLNKSFEILEKGRFSEEKRLEIAKQLNENYSEQIGNVDLLTASNEELLKIKQDIIKTEVEGAILEKKLFAERQIDNEIRIRQEQILAGNISDARKKTLEDEIQFLDVNGRAKIALVEQETRIRLGLEKALNEDILEEDEDAQKDREAAGAAALAARQKQFDEFNKLIAEILKRGEQARLNDQFLAEEERVKINRDAQRAELANLLEHAQDLNEVLTGSRELDQEVIDAFNRADEKIITDAQDKIGAILDKRSSSERAKELANDQAILSAKQQRYDQQIALLTSQEQEELALVDQQQKRRSESELEFETRLQLEKLQVNEFYLQEKADLLDRELALKLNALTLELDALAVKEGEEVAIKRRALEEKRDLLLQETDTQKAQYGLQIKNTQDAIKEIEDRVPTLGEVFGKIQEKFAESLGLDAEQVQAIASAVKEVASQIFNTIQEGLEGQIEANDEILDKLDERRERVQQNLENEIEFAKLGYASNVDAKRAELAQIEEAEFQAQKQREDLLRQQQLFDELTQISSLVTASANLFKTLSPLPFGIGIALAGVLTGAMFTAFAATKAKAKNATKLEKGGHGDSIGLVSGKRHSNGGESFLDNLELEDGEMWSVYNRKGSNKYSDLIRSFTDAVNTDNISAFLPNTKLPEKLMKKNAKLQADGIELQSILISNNLSDDMSALPEIKKALLNKFSEPSRSFLNKNGEVWMIEIYPNGSKKKTKLNING